MSDTKLGDVGRLSEVRDALKALREHKTSEALADLSDALGEAGCSTETMTYWKWGKQDEVVLWATFNGFVNEIRLKGEGPDATLTFEYWRA